MLAMGWLLVVLVFNFVDKLKKAKKEVRGSRSMNIEEFFPCLVTSFNNGRSEGSL